MWTIGANYLPHNLLHPRLMILFPIYSSAHCGDLPYFEKLNFTTQNYFTFKQSAAFAMTSSVHLCLRNPHILIRFQLNHPSTIAPNPCFALTSSGLSTMRGKLMKSNMAQSGNTLAAKPNQAMCLFTFPATAVCRRINRLRLRWTVRIQSISWCPDTQRFSQADAVSHMHTGVQK